MAIASSVVIQIASAYVGVVMGTPAHHAIVDAYNSVYPRPRGVTAWYTLDWCDLFVTHVFDKAGASDLVGREISVQTHINIFKDKGIWLGYHGVTPTPGDIITWNYDSSTPNGGRGHHIGIVEKVEGGRVHVIAGNHGSPSAVRRDSYPLTSWMILGYARPRYGDQTQPPIDPPDPPDPDNPPEPPAPGEPPTLEHYHTFIVGNPTLDVGGIIDRIAGEVIRGEWNHQPHRAKNFDRIKNKQIELIEHVFDYSTVQKRVNQMLKADQDIRKGDRVKVKKGSTTYDGGQLTKQPWFYAQVFDVLELVQDRAVIGFDGKVTTAINVKNLIKI